MFDDWKSAWREAVDNFERELHADDDVDQGRGMRRQLAAARAALKRLGTEIERAAVEAAAERDAEQVCLRRQTLALDISDDETARIAGEYAARHAERAHVYERKTEVLRDEHALLQRDYDAMEVEMAAHSPGTEPTDAAYTSMLDEEDPAETSRQDLELARLRRERAANEKLEELKRKMRG
jgi:hypothetical protein